MSIQRRGAVPRGEPVPVGEPVDVADIGQQSRRTGGADAVQVEQGRTAGNDQLAKILVRGLGLLVDGLEFGDQLDRQPAPGFAHDVS
jgi:hypothetical protein